MGTHPFSFLADELQRLDKLGLHRSLRTLASSQGPVVRIEGREVLNFSSNDYLGLAAHPGVAEKAAEAARAFGAGSGASRLVSGTLALHDELEAQLAALKGTEDALVYATGSMTNVGVISALVGKRDRIYLDALVHATIHDGARLSQALVRVFPHGDMAALSAMLEEDREANGRTLIAVDGVYSMDGDVAPLPELRALSQAHGAMLLVDDAHGTGVLGPNGEGTLEHLGMKPFDGLILVGTLSKALGTLGGFVAGPRLLKEFLVNRSRSFIFATALPPPCLGAALEALRIVREEPERRQRLWALRERLASGLQALGFDSFGSVTPILPIRVGRVDETLELQRVLWEAGFYAPAIRPPTVPRDACRIRFAVTAAHEEAHVDALLQALGRSAMVASRVPRKP